MGRPALNPSDRRTDSIRIPMTEAEKAAVWDYAERLGVMPTTWAREVLLKATRKKGAASGERGS